MKSFGFFVFVLLTRVCSGKVSPRVESTALLGSWDMFYFKGSTRCAVCHTAAPGLGQVPIYLFIFKLKATMKNETQDSVLVCITDIYIYNTYTHKCFNSLE